MNDTVGNWLARAGYLLRPGNLDVVQILQFTPVVGSMYDPYVLLTRSRYYTAFLGK